MIDDLDIPTTTEAEYLTEFGCVAIFIAASSTASPCSVGVADDLARTLDNLRASWHWSISLHAAYWIGSIIAAKQIAASIVAQTDARGHLQVEVAEAQRQIEQAAAKAKVVLTRHQDALGRVRGALAHVDGLIDSANVGGDLSWFNTAYRDYRMREGERAMPYGHARALLRRAVVRRLAAGRTGELLTADLLDGVFPGANRPAAGPDARKRGRPLPDSGEPARPLGGALKAV